MCVKVYACFMETVLRHNSTLTHVDLYGNKIGDASAETLMTALTSNSGLQRLNLQVCAAHAVCVDILIIVSTVEH